MRPSLFFALTLTAAFVAVAGCTEADPPASDAGEPPADAGPADVDSGPEDAGPPGPTWGNFAESFFASYCTSCHSPTGRASADFGQLDIVRLRLNAIRCGVAPSTLDRCAGEPAAGLFPIGTGPFPEDAERTRLVEWIDNGAPE